MKMDKYCVSSDTSIINAMQVIDDSAIATAIVTDQSKVKGILTDGDLRRALLAGAKLETSIEAYYSKQFVSAKPDTPRADVLELMQARLIEQVPIIGAHGQLLGIHSLHSILGAQSKPNWAIIMAGGKGTRLGKLTENEPKPMLKVAGRPILERLILHLLSFGIKRIFISVNYLSSVIEEFFGDGSNWGCQIEYLREETPCGSGGALSLLPSIPEHPVIVMNGDLILEANIARMLDFHKQHHFHATMGVHYYLHEVPFGCVEIEKHMITQLEEKPVLSKTVNAGLYLFSPEALQEVPKKTFFPITRIFESALDKNLPCGAYPMDGDWLDVGQPEQLNQARGNQSS